MLVTLVLIPVVYVWAYAAMDRVRAMAWFGGRGTTPAVQVAEGS
jgi:hypothetical protein